MMLRRKTHIGNVMGSPRDKSKETKEEAARRRMMQEKEFDWQLSMVCLWRKEHKDIAKCPPWAQEIDRAATLVQRRWLGRVRRRLWNKLDNVLMGTESFDGGVPKVPMVKTEWGWELAHDPWDWKVSSDKGKSKLQNIARRHTVASLVSKLANSEKKGGSAQDLIGNDHQETLPSPLTPPQEDTQKIEVAEVSRKEVQEPSGNSRLPKEPAQPQKDKAEPPPADAATASNPPVNSDANKAAKKTPTPAKLKKDSPKKIKPSAESLPRGPPAQDVLRESLMPTTGAFPEGSHARPVILANTPSKPQPAKTASKPRQGAANDQAGKLAGKPGGAGIKGGSQAKPAALSPLDSKGAEAATQNVNSSQSGQTYGSRDTSLEGTGDRTSSALWRTKNMSSASAQSAQADLGSAKLLGGQESDSSGKRPAELASGGAGSNLLDPALTSGRRDVNASAGAQKLVPSNSKSGTKPQNGPLSMSTPATTRSDALPRRTSTSGEGSDGRNLSASLGHKQDPQTSQSRSNSGKACLLKGQGADMSTSGDGMGASGSSPGGTAITGILEAGTKSADAGALKERMELQEAIEVLEDVQKGIRDTLRGRDNSEGQGTSSRSQAFSVAFFAKWTVLMQLRMMDRLAPENMTMLKQRRGGKDVLVNIQALSCRVANLLSRVDVEKSLHTFKVYSRLMQDEKPISDELMTDVEHWLNYILRTLQDRLRALDEVMPLSGLVRGGPGRGNIARGSAAGFLPKLPNQEREQQHKTTEHGVFGGLAVGLHTTKSGDAGDKVKQNNRLAELASRESSKRSASWRSTSVADIFDLSRGGSRRVTLSTDGKAGSQRDNSKGDSLEDFKWWGSFDSKAVGNFASPPQISRMQSLGSNSKISAMSPRTRRVSSIVHSVTVKSAESSSGEALMQKLTNGAQLQSPGTLSRRSMR